MAMTSVSDERAQSVEHRRYAQLLETGARLGLLVLLSSFLAYATGLLGASVPLQRLPAVWSLPLQEYLAQTQSPTGWAWLAQIGRGDGASLAGIAILAGCSMPSLLAMLPLYLRQRDRTYAALCLAEVAVIVVAASGWLTGGHG